MSVLEPRQCKISDKDDRKLLRINRGVSRLGYKYLIKVPLVFFIYNVVKISHNLKLILVKRYQIKRKQLCYYMLKMFEQS